MPPTAKGFSIGSFSNEPPGSSIGPRCSGTQRPVLMYPHDPMPGLPLDYAPPPIKWYKRRNVRRAAVGVLFSALVVFVVLAGRIVWERYREHRAWADFLARQQRGLSYTAPPDFVVYEDDPSKFEKLLASDSNYVRVEGGGFKKLYANDPVDVRGEGGGINNYFADPNYVARPLITFVGYVPLVARQLPEPDFVTDLPILFLHGRRSPDGITHLLCVIVRGVDRSGNVLLIAYSAEAVTFRTRRFVPSMLPRHRGGHFNFGKRGPNPYFTFMTGQPDPADPSHFTIGYKFAGQPGIIEGWVRNDGWVDMRLSFAWLKQKTTSLPMR